MRSAGGAGMSADNGGPAFPLPLGTANCAEPEQSGGMTLRDYFAAKALPALISRAAAKGDWKELTSFAYAMADVMLAERAK